MIRGPSDAGGSQGPLDPQFDSYRRLADVFHFILAEEDLSSLLERIADSLVELIPYDTLSVYRADEEQRTLTPVLARDKYAEQVMSSVTRFGQGITGWAVQERVPVLANNAHLDPRADLIPGTSLDPESFMSIPLIARGSVLGALNIYREGEGAVFSEEELDVASRFGDAAALALDNAHKRHMLERLAHTDSLTGLHNHRFFHERLRAELARVSRTSDATSLLMLDIDDFKRLNDIYGHGIGDEVLTGLADVLRKTIRESDLLCRLGGEEFAIVLPSSDAGDAMGLASRIRDRLREKSFHVAGRITVSMGIAQAPLHALKPRELINCSEAAMMTAKVRGKDRVVVFEEDHVERPTTATGDRDVRSIAHLKMLQSLAGKLNQLNDVKRITDTIADELSVLLDYQTCRVYVAEGDLLTPVTLRGEVAAVPQAFATRFGEGITGTAAAKCASLLISNARECEFAVDIPGTEDVDESMIAVPLVYGGRVVGVVVVVKLGIDQFDNDDLRLLEVLAGNAAVALENARLYEAERREARNAKSLLMFAETMAKAASISQVEEHTVALVRSLLGAARCALRVSDGDERAGFNGLNEAVIAGRDTPFVTTQPVVARSGGSEEREVAVAPLAGLSGWIEVFAPEEDGAFFTAERLQLLAGISYQASLAIQRINSYRAQRQSAETATALMQFGRELAQTEGMELVQTRIVESIGRTLQAQAVVMWVHDAGSRAVCARAAWSEGGATELIRGRPLPEKLGFRFLALEQTVMLEDAAELAPVVELMRLDPHASVCVAPLQLERGRAGFVTVGVSAAADGFRQHRRMELLSGMADQAKLAINSAASFENLESTFLSTVEALANALEAKDEYTSSHARWITDASLAVGRRVGLDAAALKNLELAALFHDIGKIGIPHDILLKPGPLSEAEWQVMKTHPELGEKILAPIERLAPVRPIVRHCHERYDGLGYPDGLQADRIPIESRIIFVCDAFHAMTTDRPYRLRISAAESCTVLLENSGSQFDPRVVEVFIALLGEQPELAAAV